MVPVYFELGVVVRIKTQDKWENLVLSLIIFIHTGFFFLLFFV